MNDQPFGEVVLFFRDDHFYPIQFMGVKPAEIEVQDHVALNPEVIRVERMNGEILWERASAMNDLDLTALIDRHNIKAIYRIKAMDSFSVTLASGNFGFGKSVAEALANAEKPDAQNVMGPANDDRSK